MEEKKCPRCGAVLPAEATLCPSCMARLNKRTAIKKHPVGIPLRHIAAGLAVLLAAAVCVWLAVRPRTYDNGSAQVSYRDGKTNYTVMVSFDGTSNGVVKNTEKRVYLPAGDEINALSRVYVLGEDGSLAADEFRGLVDSTELALSCTEGDETAVRIEEWGVNESFPDASYTGVLNMTGADSTQQVQWTLHMKNGDTIRLYHTLYVKEQQTVTFKPEDTPMETEADLAALVEKINTEVDKHTIAEVWLPAGVYNCDLAIQDHAFNVRGAVNADGTPATELRGTITVSTEGPNYVELENLALTGNGGNGLDASAAMTVTNCSFTGYDKAIAVHNGAFVHPTDCTFRDNQTALDFNTASFHMDSPDFTGNVFERNGTAILLESLPGGEDLDLSNCVFRENGADIVNHSERGVDTSGAKFYQ